MLRSPKFQAVLVRSLLAGVLITLVVKFHVGTPTDGTRAHNPGQASSILAPATIEDREAWFTPDGADERHVDMYGHLWTCDVDVNREFPVHCVTEPE